MYISVPVLLLIIFLIRPDILKGIMEVVVKILLYPFTGDIRKMKREQVQRQTQKDFLHWLHENCPRDAPFFLRKPLIGTASYSRELETRLYAVDKDTREELILELDPDFKLQSADYNNPAVVQLTSEQDGRSKMIIPSGDAIIWSEVRGYFLNRHKQIR